MQKEMDNWICFKFRIPVKYYLKRYGGKLNALTRIILNGQNRFLGRSNREFKKTIVKGYYRSYITSSHICFHFLLKFDLTHIKLASREFEIRIRKVFNVKVDSLPLDLLDEVDKLLLSLPMGLSNFKRIN